MQLPQDIQAWIEAANRRYATEGIPHKGRPFRAMSDFTRERHCSLALDDPLTKAIFQWFYDHSPPRSHEIGSVYTGVYLFDAAFWPVSIPVIFGQVRLNSLNCLETMPTTIKKMLESSRQELWNYVVHWTNCIDYGYGQMDLEQNNYLKPRALKLLNAGHAELIGANSQLLEPRTNVKAILSLRMATEIFLKTILVQELDLTEDELRKISHKLSDAATKCAEATRNNIWSEIAERTELFPPISARYDNTDWPAQRVWQACSLTQLAAATLAREYTDRDIRSTIMQS